MSQWAAHFQAVSRRSGTPRSADFGALPLAIGQYSIAELSDLIKAKDELMRRMDVAWTERPQAPFDTGSWETSWATLQANYAKARANAESALAMAKWNPLPATLISADTVYKGILTAMNPSWQSNTVAPGSYGDLAQQLGAMGATMDTSPLPQPTRGSDAGLTAYQQAKGATTVIEQGGAAAAGGAVDAVKAAGKGFFQAMGPSGLVFIAGVVALGVMVVPKLLPAGRLLR